MYKGQQVLVCLVPKRERENQDGNNSLTLILNKTGMKVLLVLEKKKRELGGQAEKIYSKISGIRLTIQRGYSAR